MSQFIHAITPIKAQIQQMRLMGYEAEADQLEAILRKVDRGIIRTLTQLRKAQEEIKWTR